MPDHTNMNRGLNIPDKHIAMSRQINQLPSCQKTAKTSYPKKRLDDIVACSKSDGVKCEMDEYDLYGQLLAKKLRKLDEHQRDLAMHDIDNVMFRAKMRSANPQTRSYSTSPSPVPRKLKSPVFIVAQHNISTNLQYEDENIPYQEQPPS